VSGMLQFDAEAARRVEAVYLTPDVVQQRREVLRLLALRPGERVLDIGSGPGLLSAEMAAAVGVAGAVRGIDVSDSMLALAGARVGPAGSAPMEFRRAGAEKIPYPDGSFDVAVSTQVLEYVRDIPRALAEIHRVLRPGGRVLLLDTDWDSIVWRSTDHARMQRMLAAWEQHLVDPHLPRTLKGSLQDAGFTAAPPQVLVLLNVGFEAATFSAGLIDLITRFVIDNTGLDPDEADAWAADLRSLGPDYFFSLNRYVFLAAKSQTAEPA
jgi:arsenite methyltransferase